ncbi:MAG: ribulose-phosphate 3-epimerase, partial [Candidatus Bipolaricaulota bacterium]|nr:ribulose-phosphate 3-epimerase [Candidatus Bipolaricaulota bacterium]MDW8141443.1 ribulose-phosphate 3-epimerase [Candidatus Bipolaricaulota bacterium]
IDVLLVMSVEPGFAGQSFLPATLDKIRKAKALIATKRANVEIEVDGGVNRHNVREIAQAGADILVAAKAVFGQENPRAALQALQHAASA